MGLIPVACELRSGRDVQQQPQAQLGTAPPCWNARVAAGSVPACSIAFTCSMHAGSGAELAYLRRLVSRLVPCGMSHRMVCRPAANSSAHAAVSTWSSRSSCATGAASHLRSDGQLPAGSRYAMMHACTVRHPDGTPRAGLRLACRDECVTAHIPDQQWELILQSLRASGNNESQLNNIPAAVVVEAGVLVSTCMQTHPVTLQQRLR